MTSPKKQRTDETFAPIVEEWNEPPMYIDDVIWQEFEESTGWFFEEHMYEPVVFNEGHWLHALFNELMLENGDEDVGITFEDFLDRLHYYENENEEIPMFEQKIIWKFISEEFM